MTSPFTDVAIQSLVDRLVRHQELEIAAREREDTRAGNQQVRHIGAALDALEASAAGRAALERLMGHDLPEVRMRAARRVMRWSPNPAIPVLGQLAAHWRPKDPRKGNVGVGFYAGLELYRHFGVTDFDSNKLVEPLRAYGIDMPRQPR
jgi:hypothetical protein